MVMYMVKTPSWPVDRLRTLLDRILDETGMSQAQLAALVPMDQSQLSRWKGGTSRPKFESLVTLGTALQRAHPALRIGPDELAAAGGYSTAASQEPKTPPASTAPASEDQSVTSMSNERLVALILEMKAQHETLVGEIQGLRQELRELARPEQDDGDAPGEREAG